MERPSILRGRRRSVVMNSWDLERRAVETWSASGVRIDG